MNCTDAVFVRGVMMNENREITYIYPFSKESLYEKLNDRRGQDHNYGDIGEYLIKIKDNGDFFLGVGRGGHAGDWYIAHVSETNGKITINGKIVYDPDENGNKKKRIEKKETVGEKITSIVGYILAVPAMIVLLPVIIVAVVIDRMKNKNTYTKTSEERLDDFMINFLGCQKPPEDRA